MPSRRTTTRILAACLIPGVALGLIVGTAGKAGADEASKVAQAKRGLLVLPDLPKGWTSSSSGEIYNSTPGAAQLAGCLGIPTSVVDANPPTAYSRQFSSKNQQLSVVDNVSIYPSARAARDDYDIFTNPKVAVCLTSNYNGPGKARLASETGAGQGLGQVLVSREPAGSFARHSANYVMFLPITTGETTLNVQTTVVDVIKGNVEQTVELTSVDATFPPSLSRQLTTVAAGRI